MFLVWKTKWNRTESSLGNNYNNNCNYWGRHKTSVTTQNKNFQHKNFNDKTAVCENLRVISETLKSFGFLLQLSMGWKGGAEAKSWAGQANSRRIFKMAPQFECNKMIEERKLKIKVSAHTHSHSHGHGIDIKYCENIWLKFWLKCYKCEIRENCIE